MESYEMESWHQYDMYTWLIVMFSEIVYETENAVCLLNCYTKVRFAKTVIINHMFEQQLVNK